MSTLVTFLPLPLDGDGGPLVITIHLKTSLDELGQLHTHRSMELTFAVQVPGRMYTTTISDPHAAEITVINDTMSTEGIPIQGHGVN